MMVPQNYYSSTLHARNRRRENKGNILTYVIPGLKRSIDIPFPDRKLPVCKRCKKIYKTRELCRIRDGHTDVPWNTTYVCVSMDDSCFTRDKSGDMRLIDEETHQLVARSITGPPMPYRAKTGCIGGTKTPICMACKDKNYTRHHCREKQQHQQLPWNTVYVMFSAIPYDSSYPQSGFIVEDDRIGSKRSSSSVSSESLEERTSKRSKTAESCDTLDSASTGTTPPVTDETDETASKLKDDNIHKISPSRAFLLVLGKDECIIQWLEIDPLVPRPGGDYGKGWENNENIEPMYPNPMMSGGNFPPPHGWPGYNGMQQCFPTNKYPPMMGMGGNGNFYNGGGPPSSQSYLNSGMKSDPADQYLPSSSSSSFNSGDHRQPSGYNQQFDPSFGGGSGMMNGPGPYNQQGMFGLQGGCPDDRENNGSGSSIPYPGGQKHFQDGPSHGGNGNNSMMGMNRNYPDYNNGMNNNQGYFPPSQQNGYNGGANNGNDYFRRMGNGSNNHGASSNMGPPFHSNSNGRHSVEQYGPGPQQQGSFQPQYGDNNGPYGSRMPKPHSQAGNH